jgi:hypothetical protein
MKKLSLKSEDVSVETFETAIVPRATRGTVRAHDATGSSVTCPRTSYTCGALPFAGDDDISRPCCV